MHHTDQLSIKKGGEANRLDQYAEAFRVVTEMWLKYRDVSEPPKSDNEAKKTLTNRLLEPDANLKKPPITSKILQEAADLNVEELKQLQIQLAKAFLKEVDDKLARGRTNQGQFKTRTIFD